MSETIINNKALIAWRAFTMNRYIVLILSLFLVRCASHGVTMDEKAVQTGYLFDLHVGMSWTYQVEGEDSKTVTNKITAVRTIGGQQWYKLIEYGDIFWVRNTERGQVEAANFFARDPAPEDKPEEALVFKYPVTNGETWDNLESPTTYNGTEVVTVPAGTFECHIYFIDMGNGSYSKSCIANNVGVVYNEFVPDEGSKEISRLIRYE